MEKFVFHLQGVDERALRCEAFRDQVYYITSLMLCREDEHLLQLEQDLRAVLLKISTSDAVLTTLPSGTAAPIGQLPAIRLSQASKPHHWLGTCSLS